MKGLISATAAALLLAGATFAVAQAPNDGTPPPSQPTSPVDKLQDTAPTTGGTSSGNANPTAGQAESIPGEVGQDLSNQSGSAGTGAAPSPSTEMPAKNPADKQVNTQKSGQ